MVEATQEVGLSTTGGDDPYAPPDPPTPQPYQPYQPAVPPAPQSYPPAGQQAPPQVPYDAAPGQRKGWGAGRIVVIVLAALLALFGLAVAAGGGALEWAQSSRDSNGFLTTGTERLTTPTAVLTSDSVNIQVEGTNWFVDHLGSLRVQATSRNGKPLFIGVGPLDDVRTWAGASATDQIRDLHFQPFSVSYDRQAGALAPVSPPAKQKFWSAQSTGGATQTLTWKITGGDWAIVVANADGSPGVDVQARLGAKFSWLGPLTITLLVVGIVLFLIGVFIIVLAVRGRRKMNQQPPPPPPWQAQAPAASP